MTLPLKSIFVIGAVLLDAAGERDIGAKQVHAARERNPEPAGRVGDLEIRLVDVEAADRELADVELRVERERREAGMRRDGDVQPGDRTVERDREARVVVELADSAAVRRDLDLELLRGHRAGAEVEDVRAGRRTGS